MCKGCATVENEENIVITIIIKLIILDIYGNSKKGEGHTVFGNSQLDPVRFSDSWCTVWNSWRRDRSNMVQMRESGKDIFYCKKQN